MIGPIEKGVPVPTPRQTGIAKALREMEVGDSRTFAETTQVRVSANVAYMHKHSDLRFTIRKEGTSVRVWRVA